MRLYYKWHGCKNAGGIIFWPTALRKWLVLHSECDPSPLTVQTSVKVTSLNHFITTYSAEIRQAKRSATSGEQFRFDSTARGFTAARAAPGPDSQTAVRTGNCPRCWFWQLLEQRIVHGSDFKTAVCIWNHLGFWSFYSLQNKELSMVLILMWPLKKELSSVLILR